MLHFNLTGSRARHFLLFICIITILIKKKQKKPRYTLRERLFILWQMETYQIPRRKVTEYFGIARSTLYRWLHKIEDQQQTSIPANKTPLEIAVLIWEITKSNINWGQIGRFVLCFHQRLWYSVSQAFVYHCTQVRTAPRIGDQIPREK